MEGLYYPYSEIKGADQLRCYREADLRLCFRICKTLVFSWRGSIVYDCKLVWGLPWTHYINMLILTVIFTTVKRTIFRPKIVILFLNFAQNINCGYSRIHNLCFRAKLRTLMYTPCKPHIYYMSRIMRKPDFCICENKRIDQLRGNRKADQRLCFHYTDSTIPLLPKSEISSL